MLTYVQSHSLSLTKSVARFRSHQNFLVRPPRYVSTGPVVVRLAEMAI